MTRKKKTQKGASTSAKSPQFHLLTSNDGQTFRISEKAIQHSLLFKDMFLACNSLKIPLRIGNVNGRTMSRIVEWCEKHKLVEPMCTIWPSKDISIPPDDYPFFNISGDELLHLLLAADFLAIQTLYFQACRIVCEIFQGKTSEKVKGFYRLMSEEEKKQWKKDQRRLPREGWGWLNPIAGLFNLRSFDIRALKHRLPDVFFFAKKTEIGDLCLRSEEFRSLAKDFVTISSLTEKEKNEMSLRELIDVLLLEKLNDEKKFYDGFKVLVTISTNLEIYFQFDTHDFIISFGERGPGNGNIETFHLESQELHMTFIRGKDQREFLYHDLTVETGFTDVLEFFKRTFSITSIDVRCWLKGRGRETANVELAIHWLRSESWEVRNILMIAGDKLINYKSFELFFDNFTATGRIDVMGKRDPSWDYHFRPNAPEITVFNSVWVKFRDLLSMEGKQIHLRHSSFTDFDMSQYINHWGMWKDAKRHEHVQIFSNVPNFPDLEAIVNGVARGIKVKKNATAKVPEYILQRPDKSTARMMTVVAEEFTFIFFKFYYAC